MLNDNKPKSSLYLCDLASVSKRYTDGGWPRREVEEVGFRSEHTLRIKAFLFAVKGRSWGDLIYSILSMLLLIYQHQKLRQKLIR